MSDDCREVVGFSPGFLRVVVRELEIVQTRIDKLDARIERASKKERLSAQRAEQVRYGDWLRRHLLR
jgi:hypothetical protein